MKSMVLFCFVLLGLAFMANAQSTDKAYQAKLKSLYNGTITTVAPADLAKYIDNNQAPTLLDTRSPREYEVSHIANAHFVDYKNFSESDVSNLDKSKPVVVYCTVGYRSERIGEKLKDLGFKTVFNLYGGIFEWVNQGHKVVDAKGNQTFMVHAYSEDWGKWLKKGVKIYE